MRATPADSADWDQIYLVSGAEPGKSVRFLSLDVCAVTTCCSRSQMIPLSCFLSFASSSAWPSSPSACGHGVRRWVRMRSCRVDLPLVGCSHLSAWTGSGGWIAKECPGFRRDANNRPSESSSFPAFIRRVPSALGASRLSDELGFISQLQMQTNVLTHVT